MTVLLEDLKAYVLCRYANQSSLYSSWISKGPHAYEIVETNSPDFVPPRDCGIVITHEHYRWEEIHALRRIYEQRLVPTLVLADGILEYRNTWDNPTIPENSMYQPLMADKIACIGNRSARLIEFWGNRGKTEIIGLPRLDPWIDRAWRGSRDPFKLVVATANTPSFTESQRQMVVRGLKALRNTLESRPFSHIEVEWRITAGIDQELGMDLPKSNHSLLDAIDESNAVITTPSTIYLESLLLKKPTAILDFSNSPQFTTSAWTIAAESHISATIQELLDPAKPKCDYQDFVLLENLCCESPAGPRMVHLVNRMIAIGHDCRLQNKPIEFPKRIIESPAAESLDGRSFSNDEHELARLQSELNQAIHRLGTLPNELNDKNTQIQQLQSALDESRRRVADVRSRLFKLRKILGIGKENRSENVSEPTD